MNISPTMHTRLRNMFVEASGGYFSRTLRDPNYDNNLLFHHFLQVDIEKDKEFFIPVLGLYNSFRAILAWMNANCPDDTLRLCYPLYVSADATKKTGDSIIQAISDCPSNLRLVKINTTKGIDYYGGGGIAMDDKWNPLMLLGYQVKLDLVDSKIQVIRPSCKIDPSVFTNADILSKAIIKKVIPFFSYNSLTYPYLGYLSGTVTFPDSMGYIPINIEKLNPFFTEVTSPKDLGNIDDEIYECLNNNLDKII